MFLVCQSLHESENQHFEIYAFASKLGSSLKQLQNLDQTLSLLSISLSQSLSHSLSFSLSIPLSISLTLSNSLASEKVIQIILL